MYIHVSLRLLLLSSYVLASWERTSHFDELQARSRKLTEEEPRSAIVIGSGFSGIAAAQSLAEAGWNVKVLEKLERLGGRAWLDCDSLCFPETHCVASRANTGVDCSDRREWLGKECDAEGGEAQCKSVPHPDAGECFCADMGCQWLHGVKTVPQAEGTENSRGLYHLANFKYKLKNMLSDYCNQLIMTDKGKELDQFEAFHHFLELGEYIAELRDEMYEHESPDISVGDAIDKWISENDFDHEDVLQLKIKVIEVYELDAGDSIYNLSLLEGPPWPSLKGPDTMMVDGMGALIQAIIEDVKTTYSNVEVLNQHEVTLIDTEEGATVHVEVGATCSGKQSADDGYCAGVTRKLKADKQRGTELRNRMHCEADARCRWDEGISKVMEADLIISGIDIGTLKRTGATSCRNRAAAKHESHTMDQDHRNGGKDVTPMPEGGWTKENCEGDGSAGNTFQLGLFNPPLSNGLMTKSIDAITFGTLDKVHALYNRDQVRYFNNKEYNLYVTEDDKDSEFGWSYFIENINMNYYHGGKGGNGVDDSCVFHDPESELDGVEVTPKPAGGWTKHSCEGMSHDTGRVFKQAFDEKKDAPYPMITNFTSEPFSDIQEDWSDQEIFDKIVEVHQLLFPGIGKPIKIARSYWTEWLGGSYTSLAVGVGGGSMNRLCKPISDGRLWIVGEHTDYDWFGYAHGAWASGHQRVETILEYVEEHWNGTGEDDGSSSIEDGHDPITADFVQPEPMCDCPDCSAVDEPYCREIYDVDSCNSCEDAGGGWHTNDAGEHICLSCCLFDGPWTCTPRGQCADWCTKVNRPFKEEKCDTVASESMCPGIDCPLGTCALRVSPCCHYECIDPNKPYSDFCAGKYKIALTQTFLKCNEHQKALRTEYQNYKKNNPNDTQGYKELVEKHRVARKEFVEVRKALKKCRK